MKRRETRAADSDFSGNENPAVNDDFGAALDAAEAVESMPAESEPEPERPAAESLFSSDTCELMANLVPFGIIALVTHNPRWELNDKEAAHLAPAWDRVLSKYVPAVMEKWTAEAELLALVLFALVQRAGIPGLFEGSVNAEPAGE